MVTFFEDIWSDRFDSSVYFPDGVFKERIALRYEFEFYLSEGGSSIVGGKRYAHKKGMLLVVKPNQKRLSTGSFICDAAHFTCNDSFFEVNVLRKLPVYCYLPEAEKIFKKLSSIHFTNPIASELNFSSAIMNILSLLTESYPIPDNTVAPANMLYVKSAVDHIKSHWQETIAPDILYKNQYISRSAFFSSFKAITGYTPGQYCNIVKTEHAKYMLSSTDKSIALIANECAFCSQSYFNCVFKGITGYTPLQYRKANANKLFF